MCGVDNLQDPFLKPPRVVIRTVIVTQVPLALSVSLHQYIVSHYYAFKSL